MPNILPAYLFPHNTTPGIIITGEDIDTYFHRLCACPPHFRCRYFRQLPPDAGGEREYPVAYALRAGDPQLRTTPPGHHRYGECLPRLPAYRQRYHPSAIPQWGHGGTAHV